jgi:hypothetical protein
MFEPLLIIGAILVFWSVIAIAELLAGAYRRFPLTRRGD